MKQLKRKIMMILVRDGVYSKDDLFILDKGKYFILKKGTVYKRYDSLYTIITEWFYKTKNGWGVREKAMPCNRCKHRPRTYEDWIFRKKNYPNNCRNAFEDVAVHCNGVSE